MNPTLEHDANKSVANNNTIRFLRMINNFLVNKGKSKEHKIKYYAKHSTFIFTRLESLFFSEIYLNRHPREIKIFAQFIFYKPFVRVLYVLRKICKKCKSGGRCW